MQRRDLTGPGSQAAVAPTLAMPLLLASVTSLPEARLAQETGADIIDAKDPSSGALGALPLPLIREIRAGLPNGAVMSATIGDLPCDPIAVAEAVQATARTAVQYVKVGVFPGGDPRATIAALGRLDLGAARLVGLLLADRSPDFALLPAMANARFAGVMLDTAAKDGRSLTAMLSTAELAQFVATAAGNGLFSGFAGSLRLSDLPALMRLKPNVLGFRGALSDGGVRTRGLSREASAGVRAEIDRIAGRTAHAPDRNR